MNRKWTVLAVALASSALTLAGAAIAADDEESPLAKNMEKVQVNHTKILKSVRNAAGWKKAQKDAVAAANDLVKLGKDSKPLGGEVVKEKKKTQKDWDDKMDAFIAEAEAFSKVAAADSTGHQEAKKAYNKVSATCTSCHNDFRPDE